jgi:alkanesulfonate monooxygenase SsuD/methylene tetrahydromethanopterin reductase-like flavin-dependent oxidoreductase (luciferase family)
MTAALQFGLNVNPNHGGLAHAERIARIADEEGIDLVGVQDHPYNSGLYDTFTLITWLAARTSRVRFFPNVANLPLRSPAMLAKQAASIDSLSGGRFELGLGAGAFGEAVTGMGGPSRSTREAREALGEAIAILRSSWAGEPFAFHGSHYELPGVQPGPQPAHPIGIWLGVTGPRAAALVGAKADGWSVSMPYVPPPKLGPLNDIITNAALKAGRDPAGIVRLYNVMGFIDDVPQWVDLLTGLHREHGMNAFTFWPSRDREKQSRLFAQEVAPVVRAQSS